VLTPLSDSELAGLKWFPVEPGTIHFYHQATPLQRAMQVSYFIFYNGMFTALFRMTYSMCCAGDFSKVLSSSHLTKY
jgi:hypothetical protein